VRKVKDDDNNPIFINPMVGAQSDVPTLLGDPVWISNQIPTNLTVGASSDCTEIYYGDPRRLIIGRRSTLVIEASKEAAFKKWQVAIRSMARVDFGIETANQWVRCVHVR
jgi:HK97 family phage major capsid protein